MLTASAAVTNYVNANNVAWHGDLFTLTLVDATVFRWTTADRDLVYGGQTYLSGVVLHRSSLRVTAALEVDTVDVSLAAAAQLAGKSAARRAIEAYFDDARLQIDHLVGSDVLNAIANTAVMGWYEGRVGGIEPSGLEVKIQVMRGDDLNTMLPQFFISPACSHAVYDPNCALVKGTFTDAGTVSNNAPTTTSIPSTTAAVIARAAAYYNLGVIGFTSGALAGVRRAVLSHALGGGVATIVPYLPFPQAPAVGDAFTIYPGCDRTQPVCVNKFANLVHFRGFPHIPPPEGGM